MDVSNGNSDAPRPDGDGSRDGEGGPDLPWPADRPARTVHEVSISTRSMVRAVGVVLGTLALLWAMNAARSLVSMLVISVFFALALLPGVNFFQHRRGWRRGSAVGVIYLVGAVGFTLLILVLIPAIAELARRIGDSGGEWLTELDSRLEDNLGIDLFDDADASSAAVDVASGLEEWSDEILGQVVSIASSGIGFIFQMATIAMFTFYFAADFPRLQRSFLSWFRPELQQRLGWTIDEAVRQTGGYFYSRLLLMAINGLGFFATMVAVGMSAPLAFALSLFGGFVSVFIPAIGTYIGGAVPILITLADQGFGSALIVLAYVLVYQQIENYWLSPKLSSQTMTLNGGVAFGSALAGGALFGPMGAFMALPVAALITSFVQNYRQANDVVYRSVYDTDDSDPAEATGVTDTD